MESMQELYQRVLPALKTRKKELKRAGYFSIEEKDIWWSLVDLKWKEIDNLELCDIVDDILNSNVSIIEEYLTKSSKRTSTRIDDNIL